jgi:hypothetical protein
VDFSRPDAAAAWVAIDDGVMGGCSNSRLYAVPGDGAVFAGVVSLEQNGGFASVRASVPAAGRAGVTHYVLQVLGDGKRYKLALREDQRFDGVSWQAGFQPPAGQWQEVRLPLADFVPMFRGRVLSAPGGLEPENVRQVGLVIADRQAGPFVLGLRTISTLGGD